MNKKLPLKLSLILALLSLSLISCDDKNNIYKANPNTQNSIKKENHLNQDATTNQDTHISQTANPATEEDNNINQHTDINVKEDQTVSQSTTPAEFKVAGGSNIVPGTCEYSLAELNATPRITPSNITKNSTFYHIETVGNTYVDVIFDVSSLCDESKRADDIISTKIKIKDNEYSCFSLVESSDGTDFKENDLINPLERRNIHYVAEVPKDVITTGEFNIILTINEKEFSNKFQLDSLKFSLDENTLIYNQADSKPCLTEDEYYIIIKEAKQREQDYIDSIDDPHVKQSVQSSHAAAVAESSALYLKYPDDTETIDAALRRVLNGE